MLYEKSRTKNDLKPPETNWNRLKPPETTQKLPETTWNQPYYSIFLLKVSYSQVAFVLILHPKVFLRKFGRKNWRFPNWTKFGTWVHYHILILILIFIFSKFLSLMLFWANLVPKSEVLQINWNILQGLFFSKSLPLMFFEQIWSLIWISPNWLKFRRGVHCYLFTTILMFVFSKFCHSLNFRQIWFQNLMFFQIDWNSIQGHIIICWLRFWRVIFRRICPS